MRGLQAHSRAAMANSSSAASCRTRLLHGNYKHRQLVKELLGHYKNYQMRTKACFQANVVSQPQVSASRKAGLRSPAADAARQPMLSCHTQSPATSWQLYRHTMRHIGCSASSAAAATAQAPPAAAQEQQSSTTTHLQRLRDSFQIHNTMTRCKEHFQPRPDMGDKVQMYVCGVTVYDYSHIGELSRLQLADVKCHGTSAMLPCSAIGLKWCSQLMCCLQQDAQQSYSMAWVSAAGG
eukprot:GHRR01020688.1.p1 GENE.GHRR01020688.1~~GHRR01020688.1.p1  ORF type:complete len:237 (+),score=60.83 GHRR01020688.1:308-1018(+)